MWQVAWRSTVDTTGGTVRIIGGEIRGRRLFTPRGRKLRPTADRIREAIFNILGDSCRGAHVIDLFAGTGALGLEALSRGADSAVFIDNDPAALDIIQRNVAACGMEVKARSVRWDIQRNLNCLRGRAPRADLVFMDPPYNMGMAGPALNHLHQIGLLAAGARLVIEQALDEPPTAAEGPYRLTDRRRYGKTLVSFLTYVV